ncbi:hypothetical protein FRX31_033974 [Thalictrum thalictroides]|uniref:Uncharacterized protein n=1 Tax=Thalictrum thalictroides TaxID=46969 RepID=A0A7J6UVD4_THATH|nr:hypothetical protein FRX31_033974 [Thalictrum thalictroides]
MLEQAHPSVDDDDTMRWILSPTSQFTVRSMYDLIAEEEGAKHFPYKLVWEPEIPYKEIWEAVMGGIATHGTRIEEAHIRNWLENWPPINATRWGVEASRNRIEPKHDEAVTPLPQAVPSPPKAPISPSYGPVDRHEARVPCPGCCPGGGGN